MDAKITEHQIGDLFNVLTVLAPTTQWLISYVSDLSEQPESLHMHIILNRAELQSCTYPLQWLVAVWSGLLDAIPMGFTSCSDKGQHRSVLPESFQSTTKRYYNTCKKTQSNYTLTTRHYSIVKILAPRYHVWRKSRSCYLHWLWVVWFFDLAISTLVNLDTG